MLKEHRHLIQAYRQLKVRHVLHHPQDRHIHLQQRRRGAAHMRVSAHKRARALLRSAASSRACRYRSTPRRASTSAISCGVLTTTAPESGSFWLMLMCASPVPERRKESR